MRSNQVSEDGDVGLVYWMHVGYKWWAGHSGTMKVCWVLLAEMMRKEFPQGSQNIALNRMFSTHNNLLVARQATGPQIYENTSQRPN
jgi:hypothetical protein